MEISFESGSIEEQFVGFSPFCIADFKCTDSDVRTYSVASNVLNISREQIKPMMGKISIELEGGCNEEEGAYGKGKLKWEYDGNNKKESKGSSDTPEGASGSDVNSSNRS